MTCLECRLLDLRGGDVLTWAFTNDVYEEEPSLLLPSGKGAAEATIAPNTPMSTREACFMIWLTSVLMC